jgi:arylformamidase
MDRMAWRSQAAGSNVIAMTPITDWDDAYANADHIPGAEGYPPRWAAAAAAFRAATGARAEIDIAYGDAPRQRLDLFRPDGAPRGLAVFVHGGYWRRFGKSDWSHLAAAAVAAGWAVAMPQYSLAPAARIHAITHEVGAAIDLLAMRIDGPIRLAGHSAGGHLAARMVCRDTPLPQGVQARIAHVLTVSGVHDLRPLLRTAINADLRLDPAEAQGESPALQEPLPGTRLTAWVGAGERPEFIRQTELIANIWTGLGAATRTVHDPGRHHFDVIDGLGEPDSPILRDWLGL